MVSAIPGRSLTQRVGTVGLWLSLVGGPAQQLQSPPTLSDLKPPTVAMTEQERAEPPTASTLILDQPHEREEIMFSCGKPQDPVTDLREAFLPAFERPSQPRIFFGGGPPNHEALRRFWRYAGGNDARIVVIGWGSTQSEHYYTSLEAAMRQAIEQLAIDAGADPESFKLNILKMPDLEILENGERDFNIPLDLLQGASGVFILGGDQVPLSEALRRTGAAQLLKERLEIGDTALAGTSAGTAIGSDPMVGGYGSLPTVAADQVFIQGPTVTWMDKGVEQSHPFFVGSGLGVVPDNVLLEQHLLRPGRHERLCTAVTVIPNIEWGVGIDDSMAASWNGNTVTAVGEGRVLIVGKNADGTVVEVASLRNGDVFDFAKGRVVSP
jgi:cyanophycinase